MVVVVVVKRKPRCGPDCRNTVLPPRDLRKPFTNDDDDDDDGAMTRQAMLRIIALPLRRPAPTSPVPLKPLPRVMTYYEFQLHQPKTQSDPAQKSKYLPQGGIIKWVQNKAGTTWAGFGQAQEGSWRVSCLASSEERIAESWRSLNYFNTANAW